MPRAARHLRHANVTRQVHRAWHALMILGSLARVPQRPRRSVRVGAHEAGSAACALAVGGRRGALLEADRGELCSEFGKLRLGGRCLAELSRGRGGARAVTTRGRGWARVGEGGRGRRVPTAPR